MLAGCYNRFPDKKMGRDVLEKRLDGFFTVAGETDRGGTGDQPEDRTVRAGYRGYQDSEGRNEYRKFDEVKRWDYELYLEALRELCWRRR